MSAFRYLSRRVTSGPSYTFQSRWISSTRRYQANSIHPSQIQYEYIDLDEFERLDCYVPGGYHPVRIGDQFLNRQYAVIHKLGFGRSATTWLARDRRHDRLVALKISTAESAERTEHESKVLMQLAQRDSDHPGKTMVQNLLSSFPVVGPNGSHRCLVMEAARVSIEEAKEASYHRLFHLPVARDLVAQLILGVQYVHSQGIVHGNLHLGNIFLRLPPSWHYMSVKRLYEQTGQPTRQPVVRCDGAPLDPGAPSELIVPLWLGLGSDKVTPADSSIILADFGESFQPSHTKTFTCHTPHLLAPPEAFFADSETDDPLSFPADIWTLACTIWDISGTAPPFEVFVPNRDSITREHVETFGKLPDRWWGKWANRSNWFDEDGRKSVKEELRQHYRNSARSWEERFPVSIQNARQRISKLENTHFQIFEHDEEKALGDMLKSMLVLKPRRRATIEDVVRCEWMQRWGLPGLR